MLSTLRRLRRRLLAERRLIDYLAYAAGEILLIVVGVLVALALNDWNQARQAREREAFYLASLREEFVENRVRLEGVAAANAAVADSAAALARALADGSAAQLSDARLADLLYATLVDEIDYAPAGAVLAELVASGRLEEIRSARLRRALTSWPAVVAGVDRQEASQRLQREYLLDIARGGAGSVRAILHLADPEGSAALGAPPADADPNRDLVAHPAFENNLLLYHSMAQTTRALHYRDLRAHIDTIHALIEGIGNRAGGSPAGS